MEPLIAFVEHDRSIQYMFVDELPVATELLTVEPEKSQPVGIISNFDPWVFPCSLEHDSIMKPKEIKIEIPYIDGWNTTPTRAERRKSRVRMNIYNRLTNAKR